MLPAVRSAVPVTGDLLRRLVAAVAVLLAIATAWLIADGELLLAGAVVVTAPFAFWAAVSPQRAAQAFLVVLPLLFYGASVGSLSVFVGLPIAVAVSLALLLHLRGAAVTVRPQLPATAFAVLVGVASISALLSERMVPAGSRVVYLLAFGLFAWALARAIAADLLTRRSVVEAIVGGAALAAGVLLAQSVAQLVINREVLLVHMYDLVATFAGDRAAETSQTNFVFPDPPLLGDKLVRGVVPFMVVPSAGQYLMLGFLGAVWLAIRAPSRMTGGARAITWTAVGVTGAALLATYSRQSLLGATVGLAVMLGWHRRWKMLFPAAALVALAAVVPLPGAGRTLAGYLVEGNEASSTYESYSGRVSLLHDVPSDVLVSPVIGVGPGQYSVLSPGPEVYYAHNLLLDGAVEVGLVGAAALVLLFGRALVTAARMSGDLGLPLLVAYLVANLFDDTFYFPRNGFLLAAVFAVACARRPPADDQPVAAGTSSPRVERAARWLRSSRAGRAATEPQLRDPPA